MTRPDDVPTQLVRDLYSGRQLSERPVISFELFTPKTVEGDRKLVENTLPELIKLKPDYVSVTYGAGGGTRTKTLTLVDLIQRRYGLTAMAHLTCVGHTKSDIAGILKEAKSLGIRNILALRGDPSVGQETFIKPEGGFEYSYQLIQFIRRSGTFCVGTAGFPEGHIACREGKLVDWGYLKQKVESGADFILTQLFFDNADFFRFRDHMEQKLGVTVPICPGVLPILSAKQIARFTKLCGARVPDKVQAKLESLAGDDDGARAFGIEQATEQCEELIREGVPGLHLYCLNRVHAVSAILRNLNLSDT